MLWSFWLVCSPTAWFGLRLSVLFAALALDWSSNMIVVSNAVAFLNILGVATSFGLVWLVSVLMRSGLTVRCWSRLSGRFSVHAGLAGVVLSWFGRLGIPGQT